MGNKNNKRPNENKLGGQIQFERHTSPVTNDANNRSLQDN